MRLGYFEIGETTYVINQPEFDGKVSMPTTATLLDAATAHLESGLLASIQRLHTEEPELLLYDWVGDDDRARIDTWRTEILAGAVAYWREDYDPEDFTAARSRVPERGMEPGRFAIGLFVTATLWMCVYAWLLPEGSPILLAPAVGTGFASATEFTIQLIRGCSIRLALHRTWPLTAALLVASAALALWIWSGYFPEGAGAYS